MLRLVGDARRFVASELRAKYDCDRTMTLARLRQWAQRRFDPDLSRDNVRSLLIEAGATIGRGPRIGGRKAPTIDSPSWLPTPLPKVINGELRTRLGKWMRERYERDGLTVRSLAAGLGVAYGTAYRLLTDADTAMRPQGGAHNRSKERPTP